MADVAENISAAVNATDAAAPAIDDTGYFVAYGALFIMAVVPIYIGSFMSLLKTKHEAMTNKEAAMFPVYASGTLFGLYLLFKVLSQSTCLNLSVAASCAHSPLVHTLASCSQPSSLGRST